jgi:hypothetical protein
MINSYLSYFFKKFMRTIADFRQKKNGFYLSRAKVNFSKIL